MNRFDCIVYIVLLHVCHVLLGVFIFKMILITINNAICNSMHRYFNKVFYIFDSLLFV